MTTLVTSERLHSGHLIYTSFYSYGLGIDHGIRDFLVGGADNIPEGLPRYVHPFGGVILIQALQVGQPHRLELV